MCIAKWSELVPFQSNLEINCMHTHALCYMQNYFRFYTRPIGNILMDLIMVAKPEIECRLLIIFIYIHISNILNEWMDFNFQPFMTLQLKVHHPLSEYWTQLTWYNWWKDLWILNRSEIVLNIEFMINLFNPNLATAVLIIGSVQWPEYSVHAGVNKFLFDKSLRDPIYMCQLSTTYTHYPPNIIIECD